MIKLLLASAIGLTLTGCATLQKLQTVWTTINTATVSPKTIVVAANAFDGLEGTATNYLKYCKANLSQPICVADNRQVVIQAVRKGRTARNQLETYIISDTPAPAPLYNVLIGALNLLTSSPATAVGAK